MKRLGLSLAVSLATAAYWWIVFITVYADTLFAGDRDPSMPSRPAEPLLTHNGATIVIGVLVYAALSMLWHRLARRWQG